MNLFRRFLGREAASPIKWQVIHISNPTEISFGSTGEGIMYAFTSPHLNPGYIRFMGAERDVGTVIEFVIAPLAVKEEKFPAHQLSGKILLLPWMSPEGSASYGSQQIPRHPTFYTGPLVLCLRHNGRVQI